jgi:flagellar protein FliS
MSHNPYESSLETRVLSATPLELVTLLYDGAIDAVRAARGHLRSGDIWARTQAITKAVSILLELSAALDHREGSELGARLDGLYGYMRWTLLEANYTQREAGLITVEELLVTVRESWYRISAGGPVADPTPETPAAVAGVHWGFIGERPLAERHWNA